MHNLNFSAWQTPYQAALAESDEGKLDARVDVAEAAILHRLQALSVRPEAYHELHALAAALTNLLILKNETRNFSQWKPDSLEAFAEFPYRPN